MTADFGDWHCHAIVDSSPRRLWVTDRLSLDPSRRLAIRVVVILAAFHSVSHDAWPQVAAHTYREL